MNRSEIEFDVHGVTVRAWHDRPVSDVPAPCVVMGHGFGATRNCGLSPYIERFGALGLHTLAFDYRHFGASDGEPRQLLSVKRQLADWQAALDCARSLAGVDPDRIVAWGTSFGGGHAMVAAAIDGRVAAVVAQCPMMDGAASLRLATESAGRWALLRVGAVGVRDLVGSWLGLRPVTLPVVAATGEIAAMSTPDALLGYRALVPQDWINEVCARFALQVGGYRPIVHADTVPCPVLLLVCEADSVAPASAAEAVAKRLGDRAEIHRWPIGHFDIYQTPHREAALDRMASFLERKLSLD